MFFPLLNLRLKIRYRNLYRTPDPVSPPEELILAAEIYDGICIAGKLFP